jgi:pyruvate formate lyase activating enzyme
MADSHNIENCRELSPEAEIQLALDHGCRGLAWTYNEPVVWFEYTFESARLAKQKGLYTVYVTNGYATQEALDMIAPYLDAWRVDIKGFSDRLYRDLTKIPRWQEILKTTERARHKWNMHVEVVTNIIPGMNDDEKQLGNLAAWIHDNLGALTPWHVTRFYPQYRLTGIPATPVSTLERAYNIGHQAGLKFVYTGNIPGHPGENTVCYSCRRTVIERMGFQTRLAGLNGSKCRFCGAELNIRNG